MQKMMCQDPCMGVKGLMDRIILAIVKEQNRNLLSKAAALIGVPEEDMLRKYWTPSFYLIGKDVRNVYSIEEKNIACTKNEKKRSA